MTDHPPRRGAARRWSVSRRWLVAALAAAAAAAAAVTRVRAHLLPGGPSDAEMAALYARPLAPPPGPLRVFHLGHSLVGRDMPAMLEQLAPAGHRHESQLGWGTTLKAHWEPELGIAGFETENAHPRYRDAREALQSGDYDALVVTEMLDIRDAIRYFESGAYLARWAQLARDGNPEVRVYLYETWHGLDDPQGWLERLDLDLGRSWDKRVLRPALAADPAGRPIHLVPAGQVLARLVREVEARGGVEGLRDREGLFGRAPDGSLDMVHLNDLGNYVVALVHFAVLHHRSPVGLPRELRRADGSSATAPSADAARLMQEAAWEVVAGEPLTGVAPGPR